MGLGYTPDNISSYKMFVSMAAANITRILIIIIITISSCPFV